MTTKTPFLQRPSTLVGAVLALHAGGLWALQSGLLIRTLEAVIPVEVLSQIIEPPKPELSPPPPPKPEHKPPQPVQEKVIKQPSLPPPPQPLAINDPTPTPNAPLVAAAAPAPLPPITAPVAASPAPAAAPAPVAPPVQVAKVVLPSSNADYLNNPAPAYPTLSKRTGEHGRVLLRVHVREDGSVERVELRTSSGYERLDAAALATVQRWRFKPGTRGGVAEAMAVTVPIDFNLDNL